MTDERGTEAAVPSAGTYDVAFEWHHSHGHLARLLIDRPERGAVLDLGCGYAPHAEALRDAGFTYVGLDDDDRARSGLDDRGFATAPIDLERDDIGDVLDRCAAMVDPPVVAVTALDVLEHLVEPHLVLGELATWMEANSVGSLGLSIPNASHYDLGAKLLCGRWDVTETGLLDRTHLRFFTSDSLTSMCTSAGFVEDARHDVSAELSEQRFPSDLLPLPEATPVGALLRELRRLGGPGGDTFQFVRLYRRDPAHAAAPTIVTPDDAHEPEPFLLSVVIDPGTSREQIEARLADQTSDRFEVVDADDGETIDDLLARAQGSHVAIIDAHQMPDPEWVERFASASERWPGTVLRCGPPDEPGALDQAVWPAHFDLADHLLGDASPSAALLFPRSIVGRLALDVGASGIGPAHALLLACGRSIGVVDIGPSGLRVESTWRRTGLDRPLGEWLARLDAGPLLLGPTAARRLVESRRRAADLQGALDELRRDNEWLNAELAAPPVRLLRRLMRRRPPG